MPESTFHNEKRNLRLIIIDDEYNWCTMLSHMARSLGHSVDTATTPEEAQVMVRQAEAAGQPYTVAVIDLHFKIGKLALSRGQELIQYLKQNHPTIACVVASGQKVQPDSVLDLRDDYDLDYYVQKDRISLDIFRKAIQKALARIDPSESEEARSRLLHKTLEKWEYVRLIAYNNLANVKEREAMKGINVDVTTLNEIMQYEARLAEADEHVRSLSQELTTLGVTTA